MKIKFLLLAYGFFYGPLLLGYTHMTSHEAESVHDVDGSGYMIQLMAAKPTFTAIDQYNDIYGNTSVYPSISMTYKLAHFSIFSLGLGAKFSYYSATGHPIRKDKDVSDPGSSLSLKLLPYQLYAMGKMSPFHNRYVVLDFWVGYEELYYEEVRLQLNAPATTTTTTKTSTTPQPQNQINSGWNKSLAYGVSINFLLNHFEDQSAKALNSTTDLRFIYFGPFAEWTTTFGGRLFISQQNASNVDFSRASYGLLFMFET